MAELGRCSGSNMTFHETEKKCYSASLAFSFSYILAAPLTVDNSSVHSNDDFYFLIWQFSCEGLSFYLSENLLG